MSDNPETISLEVTDANEPEVAAVLGELLRQSEEQLIALLEGNGKKAKTLKAITAEIAANPYGEEGRELFGKDEENSLAHYLDIANIYNAASPEVKAKAQELTDGGIGRALSIIQQAYPDAYAIAKAMESGQLKTLDGKRWPKDAYNLADLSGYILPVPSEPIAKADIGSYRIVKQHSDLHNRGHKTLKVCTDAETLAHSIAIPEDDAEAVILPYAALVDVRAAFSFLSRLDLEGYGEKIAAILSGNRKERRAPLKNENVLLTTSKAESAIFNPRDKDYIRADRYNGTAITIETGRKDGEASIQLALQLDFATFDFDKMTQAERAERQLSDEERFWLRGLQSIVWENPDETRIYGSDILKRWGWQNPYQKSSEATLGEVAAALERMRVISVILDTTGEQRAYEKRGKLIKSIQPRPIVDALITIEEYETSKGKRVKDFYIDLRPLNGADATDALPTLGYALEKGQLITAPREVFVFDEVINPKTGKTLAPSIPQVHKNHRRMMAYIYGQLKAKGMSNTILFSTMFETLGLELNRNTKSRAAKKLEALLEHWRARGIIGAWTFKYEGKRLSGIHVTAPRKRLK